MKINLKNISEALDAAAVTVREQQFVLVGNLAEAKFDADKRTAEVTVIRKGWSKNGFYYGDKALESIANFLNTTAERVFLNHNPRSAIFEPRLVADHIGNNVEARVTEDGNAVIAVAKFFESGPNSWTYDRMRETPHTFGPSIVGKANIRRGEAEGRKGPIVEDITYLHSYDMVATPAAGGKVNSVNENVCPTEGSEFVHIFEGIVSVEDQEFLFKSFAVSETPEVDEAAKEPTKLLDRLKQKKDRQKSNDMWYDLDYTFTSELGDIILARGDYEFVAVAERKKLINPLLNEFVAEIAKIKFVDPRPLPRAIAPAVTEVELTESVVKIVLHDPGTFEKNSFRTVTISKENGISATIGKLKNSTRKSDVRSYQFDMTKGWTETLAKSWVAKNVKSETTDNTKEGVERMFENLAELKAQNPALYESLIAEAKNDQYAQEQVKKWKDDSAKLATVTENLTAETAAKEALQTEKEALEAKNKVLEDENAKHVAEQQKVRKQALITEIKAEVGLADEFCSEAFAKVLDGVTFDPEKEADFKVAVKEHVEDRKALVENKVPAPKVVTGVSVPKDGVPVTETEKFDGKSFASKLKTGY